MYFLFFVIMSPREWAWFLIWTYVNSLQLHVRMLFCEFSRYWHTGSWGKKTFWNGVVLHFEKKINWIPSVKHALLGWNYRNVSEDYFWNFANVSNTARSNRKKTSVNNHFEMWFSKYLLPNLIKCICVLVYMTIVVSVQV